MVDPVIKEVIEKLELCYGLFVMEDYTYKIKIAVDSLLNYCDKQIKEASIGRNERLVDALKALKIKLVQYLEYLDLKSVERNAKTDKQEFFKVLINFRTALTRGRYFEEFKGLQKIIKSG